MALAVNSHDTREQFEDKMKSQDRRIDMMKSSGQTTIQKVAVKEQNQDREPNKALSL